MQEIARGASQDTLLKRSLFSIRWKIQTLLNFKRACVSRCIYLIGGGKYVSQQEAWQKCLSTTNWRCVYDYRKNSKLQLGRNNFEYTYVWNSEYFVIVIGLEDCELQVCPTSHICFHHSDLYKLKFKAVLIIKEVAIWTSSIFINDGQFQYGDSGWTSFYRLEYLTFVLPIDTKAWRRYSLCI